MTKTSGNSPDGISAATPDVPSASLVKTPEPQSGSNTGQDKNGTATTIPKPGSISATASTSSQPDKNGSGSDLSHSSSNGWAPQQNAKEGVQPELAHSHSETSSAPQQLTAPVGTAASQKNLAADNSNSSSSASGSQPIAHQPAGDHPTVKTDMSLKMQGQSGENVTVRLTERGGDIQVSVRSNDPATSALLRHELPSIQAGLERAGWQLENTQSQSSNQSGQDSQGGEQRRNDQNSGYREDQKRRSTQQNQWFDLIQ
jgi:hypothetical protein